MTDTEILTEIQLALIETPDGGLTVSSGLWTVNELIEALNTAQLWALRELWPVVSTTTLTTVPNQGRYDLPQTWLETIRVAWVDANGDTTSLGRDSSWSADYVDHDWTYNLSPSPLTYNDSDGPMPQIQVMPAGSDNGVLDVWFVSLPPSLSNTGVAWTLPDVLVPMCKWKALALLLGKSGRGQDLPRAAQALARAEEGLSAATALLQGWRVGL